MVWREPLRNSGAVTVVTPSSEALETVAVHIAVVEILGGVQCFKVLSGAAMVDGDRGWNTGW